MRGLYTPITKIRSDVFESVARAAYEDYTLEQLEELPYKIIPGEIPHYRESVYLERAIVTERIRLALNQDVRPADKPYATLTYGFTLDSLKEKNYTKNSMNVIKAACDSCKETSYFITDSCHNCIAHSCMNICPAHAVTLDGNNEPFINQDICLKCGKCSEACTFHAIVKNERPCISSCGLSAVSTDELKRSTIDSEKCVGCGQCMVNCPFGAISDKSEIYQVIKHLNQDKMHVAIVAPAFIGQFGNDVSAEQVFEAIRQLGFDAVFETSYGADMTAVKEAKHYVEHVGIDQPYLCTSCCPAWVGLAKAVLGDQAINISQDYSPMAELGKKIKEDYPNTYVTFIGPCTAKKKEAQKENVRNYIDFVLTFEETVAMMKAKDIVLETVVPRDTAIEDGSKDGRNFAISGGVAKAVVNVAKELDPNKEVLIEKVDGLKNCKPVLLMAKAGRKNGYLLEGMACPNGCIGGAGTLINPAKASGCVQTYANQAKIKSSVASIKDYD